VKSRYPENRVKGSMTVCDSCFDEIGGPFIPSDERRREILDKFDVPEYLRN
jgi:hypothetical protein